MLKVKRLLAKYKEKCTKMEFVKGFLRAQNGKMESSENRLAEVCLPEKKFVTERPGN
jgi:hypothetical protein